MADTKYSLLPFGDPPAPAPAPAAVLPPSWPAPTVGRVDQTAVPLGPAVSPFAAGFWPWDVTQPTDNYVEANYPALARGDKTTLAAVLGPLSPINAATTGLRLIQNGDTTASLAMNAVQAAAGTWTADKTTLPSLQLLMTPGSNRFEWDYAPAGASVAWTMLASLTPAALTVAQTVVLGRGPSAPLEAATKAYVDAAAISGPVLTAAQVVFGGAGGGAAQDAGFTYTLASHALLVTGPETFGATPTITRLLVDPTTANVKDQTLNANWTGSAWVFDDTTHDAFDLQMDETNHRYTFAWAAASANPPIWSTLATLSNATGSGTGPGTLTLPGDVVAAGVGQFGRSPSILRLYGWYPVATAGGSLNLNFSATNVRDDTSKDAWQLQFNNADHAWEFWWTPAGASAAWAMLAQLDSTGRWSTAGAHRFRYLVSSAAMSLASNQSIPNNVFTQIQYTNIVWNNDMTCSTTSYSIAVPVAGFYRVDMPVAWTGTVGWTFIALYKNGGQVQGWTYPQSANLSFTPSFLTSLIAGDLLTVGVQQNTGAAQTLATGGGTMLQVTYVGE